MKLTLLLLFIFMSDTIIYDFNKDSSRSDWRIIDDGVMGGVSQGKFSIDADGNGRKILFTVASCHNGIDNAGAHLSALGDKQRKSKAQQLPHFSSEERACH